MIPLKTCEHCLLIIPYKTKDGPKGYARLKFCNMTCKIKAQTKEKSERVCVGCWTTFFCKSYLHQKYCSKVCAIVIRNKSQEQRNKVSIAISGKKSKLLGRKRSRESVEKGRLSILGDKHWNWKGGISPKNNAARSCIELKEWRRAVFSRDDFTCQMFLVKGGKLEADHIKSWAHYPELRFVLSNGRTLCVECHSETPNYRGRANVLTA